MLQQSGKKVEVIEGICKAAINFLEELGEANAQLNNATLAIRLSKFDNFYNGLTGTATQAQELAVTIGDGLNKLIEIWTSREGIAPKAVEAFNEAGTSVKRLQGMEVKAMPVELSDDLNENYTDDTSAAFKKALYNFCAAKDTFLTQASPVILENLTEDTKDIFTSYGEGIESFCNALVDVFSANSSALASFNLGIDELSSSIKTSAGSLLDSAQTVSQKAVRSSMDI